MFIISSYPQKGFIHGSDSVLLTHNDSAVIKTASLFLIMIACLVALRAKPPAIMSVINTLLSK